MFQHLTTHLGYQIPIAHAESIATMAMYLYQPPSLQIKISHEFPRPSYPDPKTGDLARAGGRASGVIVIAEPPLQSFMRIVSCHRGSEHKKQLRWLLLLTLPLSFICNSLLTPKHDMELCKSHAPPPFCGMALAHKFSCSMLQNSLVQTAQSLQDALFALKLPQCLLFACMQPGMTCTVHKVYPHWNFGSLASSLPTVVAKMTKVVRNLLALSENHLYEKGSS